MTRAALSLLLLAGLVLALLSDFARWRNQQNIKLFQSGVSSYHAGRYSAAAEDFQRSAAGGSDPELAHKAVYNQGNCFVRLAEASAGKDSVAADRYFETALARYGEALRLKPADPETISNQRAVMAARQALTSRRGGAAPPSAPDRQADDPTRSGSGGKRNEPQPARQGGLGGEADTRHQTGEGPGRKTVGREEAERLLNEKRGQEALPSAIKAKTGNTPALPPEKDW